MTGLRKYRAHLWALGSFTLLSGGVIWWKLPESFIYAIGTGLVGLLASYVGSNVWAKKVGGNVPGDASAPGA